MGSFYSDGRAASSRGRSPRPRNGSMVLVEEDGKTTLTTTILFPSQQVRDEVLAFGMTRGTAENYDRLADVLASRPALAPTHSTSDAHA